MMLFCVLLVVLMIRRPPRSTRTDTLCPSRRSSDLVGETVAAVARGRRRAPEFDDAHLGRLQRARARRIGDIARKLARVRSEEHTSELQSLMRISSAAFGVEKKKGPRTDNDT